MRSGGGGLAALIGEPIPPTPMLTRYVDWLRGTALPCWAEQGFDARHGRFHERLDAAARPIEVPHRAMVQARQIFVFAQAEEAGWLHGGGALAERAMAALLRDFAETNDGTTHFRFAIDPTNGEPVSDVRDAYAHAFILFGIAALYRLNGDQSLLDLADRILHFVDRQLTDPVHGGLFDAWPAPAEKRQNPHMHLLEAYLFLAKAAPGRDYLARAEQIVALFRSRFLHDGMLLEYFGSDWSVAAPRARWEPGHHYEWIWLLDEHAALGGGDPYAAIAALWATAADHGVAANGLIVDELSTDRTVTRHTHRLWPHTEAIKAAAVLHRRGDACAVAFAEAMADRLIRHFLDRPFTGGWTDQIAQDGTALIDYVPASSLYHLTLAGRVAAEGFAAASAPAKR